MGHRVLDIWRFPELDHLGDQVGNEDEGKGLINLPWDPEHMSKVCESKRDTKTEEYIVKYETRKDKNLNTSGL